MPDPTPTTTAVEGVVSGGLGAALLLAIVRLLGFAEKILPGRKAPPEPDIRELRELQRETNEHLREVVRGLDKVAARLELVSVRVEDLLRLASQP